MKRTPIARKTRLKPVNRKRRAKLFAEDFGSKEYVEWLHAMPCAICDADATWTVAAHVRSRGAGGKVDDLVPLCATRLGVVGCHNHFDAHFPEARAHEPRLRSLAKQLRAAWLASQPQEPEA